MCYETKNWVSTPFTCRKSDSDIHSPTGFLSTGEFLSISSHILPSPNAHILPWWKSLCFRQKREKTKVWKSKQLNWKKKSRPKAHICITKSLIYLKKRKIISVYVSVKCVICSVFQQSSTCFWNKWETNRREPESQEVWLRHLLLTLISKPCQCTSGKGKLISYPLSSQEISSESHPRSEPLGCHYTSDETFSFGTS